MKERPILFSGPMVRALLDRRKTQTRRVVKPQPESVDRKAGKLVPYAGDGAFLAEHLRCPYGVPGDRLYVRETWKSLPGPSLSRPYDPATEREFGELPRVLYRADPAFGESACEKGWKPSIHMPRWASRLTLEITGVRVERLQDITAHDCIAEGIASRGILASALMYTEDYADLWQSINGPDSWAANPWVWVLDFMLVQP